jgi:hypothetical protein
MESKAKEQLKNPLMPLITDLSSFIPSVRHDATTQLITKAVEIQDGDLTTHSYVQYALTRLVRGLASPREASRQGFSSALSEVLFDASCFHVLVADGVETRHSGTSLGHD